MGSGSCRSRHLQFSEKKLQPLVLNLPFHPLKLRYARYTFPSTGADHMIFEWMSDPSAWVGLLTLVVLEIVLGIDNLVFIAILAEKLPPEQRNTARVVGLILALLMRLVLLASIAWVVTLTEPLFHIFDHPFSGRDLILLFGGVFLLFKGTMELHERIDAKVVQKEESPANAVFWMVIVQIVVLDAVFSLVLGDYRSRYG